jgi:hypothetical protein
MTVLHDTGKQKEFLQRLTAATTSTMVDELLATLSIVDEHQFQYDEEAPGRGWVPGRLHWLPIGRKRGNAGQVALAKRPIAPIAERLINGMEALVELQRQRELAKSADAEPPPSPRSAVSRYFGIPPLDQLPTSSNDVRATARNMARKLTLELDTHKEEKEFSVEIRDEGIGQTPGRMHKTLLSLGSSDKGDKPYLIGIFGQGGSSTYKASKYSWVVSRRAPDIETGTDNGVGWTIVKHIVPKGRRDHYYAYLAAEYDGRVPYLESGAAAAVGLNHGTWFCHVNYDFGQSGAAITRALYQQLNHILYNPVLPFETDVAGTRAVIYGNGYRLSNLKKEQKDLDKIFDQQPIA